MWKPFAYLAVLLLSTTVVKPKPTSNVNGHQKLKRMLGRLVRKLIKSHYSVKNNRLHKKHDVLTLAAPPGIDAMLPPSRTTTLMPNGVPASVGSYVHYLMHQHPINIPVYHWRNPYVGPKPYRALPVHLLRHYHFYWHRPWYHLPPSYDLRYHNGWYRGPGYHHGHVVPAELLRRYGNHLGYGHRLGYHRGKFWPRPLRGWYPYSFDHSVDLRGDNGPNTVFLERSSVPTTPKLARIGRKKAQHQRLTPKLGAYAPVLSKTPNAHALTRQLIRRKLIPFRYRIEHYKINLVPRKTKHKLRLTRYLN